MNAELLDFTRRALEKGASNEEIATALRQAGWGEADVRAASNAFVPVGFSVPVPKPRPRLTAQEFFTYALFFTAVYVSAWNLGALIFNFIDLWVPDASRPSPFMPAISRFGSPNEFLFDQMRSHIAALIVAFPLFLFMQRLIRRAMAADATKRESGSRKWLTYITLFVAASALIGDLSALVYNALGGELTLRLSLQLATIGVIAGGAFGYFLWDIRRDERP